MTIKKRIQFANQAFRYGVRQGVLRENPFEGIRISTAMEDRRHFLSRKDTELLLSECLNSDWRMIVVLARYGGLRCPSEVLSLRWQDIDWQNKSILVTSPKTERYENRKHRCIPLFSELEPELAAAWENADENSEYVVDEKYRRSALGPAGWKSCNLRTTFEKIVWRSGLKPWPKLFHNLRGSRVTELMDEHPITVVAQWMGHSVDVLAKHYAMVTDEHHGKVVSKTPLPQLIKATP